MPDTDSGTKEPGTDTGTGTDTGPAPAPQEPGTGTGLTEVVPDGVAVREAVGRVVKYPRLARSQELEGRVVIRFRIDEHGMPQDVAIAASAGSLLDDAARAAVVAAAPFASPPGWVRVPVDFSLQP